MSRIQEATGLSVSACSLIRSGQRTPHARHWDVRVQLAAAVLEA